MGGKGNLMHSSCQLESFVVVFCRYRSCLEYVVTMSKDQLLAQLKLVRAQTDATVELLSNTATLPFSVDDEYDADYLIGCLESSSQKLYALAKKCQSTAKSCQQEQNTGRLLTASVSSDMDASWVNQSVNQSAVEATNADTDDTASLDSSDVSTPLCGDIVSNGHICCCRPVIIQMIYCEILCMIL